MGTGKVRLGGHNSELPGRCFFASFLSCCMVVSEFKRGELVVSPHPLYVPRLARTIDLRKPSGH